MRCAFAQSCVNQYVWDGGACDKQCARNIAFSHIFQVINGRCSDKKRCSGTRRLNTNQSFKRSKLSASTDLNHLLLIKEALTNFNRKVNTIAMMIDKTVQFDDVHSIIDAIPPIRALCSVQETAIRKYLNFTQTYTIYSKVFDLVYLLQRLITLKSSQILIIPTYVRTYYASEWWVNTINPNQRRQIKQQKLKSKSRRNLIQALNNFDLSLTL